VNLELREWRDDDVDWWIPLRQAENPSLSDELLRRIASGEHAVTLWRGVALLDGAPVGYGGLESPSWTPTTFALVIVDKAHRGRGIGAYLWAPIAQEFGHLALNGHHSERSLASRPIVEHWGFALNSHAIESQLAAADFVPMPAPPPEYAVSTKTNTELTDADIAAINRLLVVSATHTEVVELGWPILLVADMQDMEPNLVWTTVWHEREVVALSLAGDEGAMWHIQYTGVDPQHRGKGLGRVAKSALHEYGIACGAQVFDTHNEERNEPMRALNAALGYKAVGGQYRYRREPSQAS
jgi:GNAT superfamily N-acetyltransferase